MKANPFKGLIYSRFSSITELAKQVGWSRQKMSRVANFIEEPSLTDIQDLARAFKMDAIDVAVFFLPEGSQKCDAYC